MTKMTCPRCGETYEHAELEPKVLAEGPGILKGPYYDRQLQPHLSFDVYESDATPELPTDEQQGWGWKSLGRVRIVPAEEVVEPYRPVAIIALDAKEGE